MDILEGCKLGYRQLKDRAKVEAREVLSKYEKLNLLPKFFPNVTEHALYRGYIDLLHTSGQLPGRLQSSQYFGCTGIFTLEELRSDRFRLLGSLAMDRYNQTRKGQWVFEEVIDWSYTCSLSGFEYFIYFGARSSQVLRLFHANLYLGPDDEIGSEVLKSVNLVRMKTRKRKVVQIGSSGYEGKLQDGCIFVRKTRKMTYLKQGDSYDIICYRNTEEDKIGSSDEKDKQVDETSMGMNQDSDVRKHGERQRKPMM